jgi:hypothetical protein
VENSLKNVKGIYSKHVKQMSEETRTHQILKVVYMNKLVEQLSKTTKSINKHKQKILDQISAKAGPHAVAKK